MQDNFTSIIEKINTAKSIVLLVHENPDGDAVGSIIGLFKALSKYGKSVDGIIEKVPSNCEFLLKSIGKEIKTFDVADLKKEYDLCIALDCGDLDRMGEAKDLFVNAKTTACLDHHFTNNKFADENYIRPDAAATGEIIFDLLKSMNIEIDTEIATALYCAISSDTGNFSHSNTSKRTFEIASQLMEYGINVSDISYHMFSESSLNRIIFMGRLLQNVEVFLDGKLAILMAKKEDVEKFNLEPSELDGIVDYARYIKGVEVGIFIKPFKDIQKISIRSNGKIDVSGVASEFNGGGHKFAAGCRVNTESGEEAKQQLIEAFSKII